MIISSIEVFFGDQIFSHEKLCESIGIDLAEKIKDKSGFLNRYITSPNTDIFKIAQNEIEKNGLEKKIQESNFIIVVSEYVQGLIPPPSSIILKNFSSESQLIIDLNRGCSGFCEALVIANSLLGEKHMNKGTIITAENYSKIISRNNRSLSPIFSDAVAFTFVENRVEDRFYSNFGYNHLRNQDLEFNNNSSQLHMNGAGLVSFVKGRVVPKLKELIDDNPIKIDYFFAHQGSKLVINSLNSELENYLLKAEFLSGEIGNINASSIPYVIKSSFKKSKSKKKRVCLLSGFGVGLSFCNVLLDLRY